MIRVGRIKSSNDKLTYPGFTPIVVMTKSSKYGSLGPYVLRNKNYQIMENIWQFSKVYQQIPASKQKYSRWDNTVIWDHPAEIHLDDNGKLTQAYHQWRHKGFNNPYPVRYPVGMKYRNKCLYSLLTAEDTARHLTYIEARKEIYLPVYSDLVKGQPQYNELLSRIRAGENLLILEVDGPHQESLSYYQKNYNVNDDFIQQGTMLATWENLKIMLDDAKHPFGHGYCLAWCLLEDK